MANEAVSSIRNNHDLNYQKDTTQLSSSYGDVRDLPTVQSDLSQDSHPSPVTNHLPRVLFFGIVSNLETSAVPLNLFKCKFVSY